MLLSLVYLPFPAIGANIRISQLMAQLSLSPQGGLTRIVLTENFNGSCSLGVSNFLVALLEGVRLEALPGEGPAEEVHEHVTESLQVISTGLLLAHVCVDGHVASRACEGLVLPIRDVLVGGGINVLLS